MHINNFENTNTFKTIRHKDGLTFILLLFINCFN